MTEWQALILAFFMDLSIGDPLWLPHPVRLMGRVIAYAEAFLRKKCGTPGQLKRAGMLLAGGLVLSVLAVTYALEKTVFWITGNLSAIVGGVLFVYLIATTIAFRGLIDSVLLVVRAIYSGNIPEARRHLSMVVGRDTENLTEKEVLTAAMETLAENLSDGVVAPVFYFALGGLPLAMAYKAVNTLDSMVGYKNETYLHLGWASARLDDLANYIPARITGLLVVASVFVLNMCNRHSRSVASVRRSYRTMRRDGRNHTSPNSGIPEAAMAGALGVRMGGPSLYQGVSVNKAYIGESAREDFIPAIHEEMRIVWVTAILAFGVAVLARYLRSGM
ncbi:MAG TPA: adenosylcobinamide-phosphate synthase CbiB [Syntrophorhabdaceae bacterium]|jgi:adenosylcobinamide-phosphate synthase